MGIEEIIFQNYGILMFSIKKLSYFLIFFYWSFNSYANINDNNNLCGADEYVRFSCQLDNKKVVSLCSKKNDHPVNGQKINNIGLMYRYGTKSHIELSYPSGVSHSKFGYDTVKKEATQDENRFHNTEIYFSLGEYKYVVGHTEIINSVNWLAVDKNDNEIFYSQCNDSSTYTNVDIFQY